MKILNMHFPCPHFVVMYFFKCWEVFLNHPVWVDGCELSGWDLGSNTRMTCVSTKSTLTATPSRRRHFGYVCWRARGARTSWYIPAAQRPANHCSLTVNQSRLTLTLRRPLWLHHRSTINTAKRVIGKLTAMINGTIKWEEVECIQM